MGVKNLKIDRLFSIVHILLNKGHVTAKELAEKFEVSSRTIYRDIDTLSMAGIPIYTDRGSGGGISILDNFVLNKTVISEEEKSSILLGLDVIKATNYGEDHIAMEKLRHLFQGKDGSFVEVDFSGFENETQSMVFEDIKDALKKSRSLKLSYINTKSEKSVRVVNPLKLVFKKQRWYLIAYCNMRKEIRSFRISRVVETEKTDKLFTRKNYDIEGFQLKSHTINNLESIRLILHKGALLRVQEEFQMSMINEREENSIIVEFEAEIDEWLCNYMMSYADYFIDVLPLTLKSKLKEKAEKIMKL
jgi:predicted DNA-binding transcriptional regulator YafY